MQPGAVVSQAERVLQLLPHRSSASRFQQADLPLRRLLDRRALRSSTTGQMQYTPLCRSRSISSIRTAAMSDPSGAPHADAATCVEQWAQLREAKPLVQCITNFVSMDLMANCLLAAGASPAMVHGEDEVEEFVQVASALLVNVGTLTGDWVRAMTLAARAASEAGKPWVLDPVGAGATKFRTQAILQLLELRPTLVRGNASEILALAGQSASTRGVDAGDSAESALEAGRQLAKAYETVVAISGEQDYVTDGEHVLKVSNGVELLTKITAAGCSVTALAAAFVSVAPRTSEGVMQAAAHALGVFGVAGQLANQTAAGPGSLRSNLLDQLFKLGYDSEPLEQLLTISVQH